MRIDAIAIGSSPPEDVTDFSGLPGITLQQIEHFFNHNKDLEPGKWEKLGDWLGVADAKRMILEAVERAGGKD